MLILNPPKLTLLAIDYSNIDSVKVDRLAHKETIEWSDSGPHAVFADIPETRVEISIVQRMEAPSDQAIDAPKPGQAGALEVITSPNASQARRKKLTAQVVIRSVRTEVSPTSARRTISLIAISPDGSTDPVGLIDL